MTKSYTKHIYIMFMFFLFIQTCEGCHKEDEKPKKELMKDITKIDSLQELNSKIATGFSVIVFYKSACPYCKKIAPVISELNAEADKKNIVKAKYYKVEENSISDPMRNKYQVRTVPRILLFKDGKEVTTNKDEINKESNRTKEKLDQLIYDTFLGTIPIN